MIEKPNIKRLKIKDILKNDFNKFVYDSYHSADFILKLQSTDIESFFNEIINDVAIYYVNNKELPYETKDYFANKYNEKNIYENVVNETEQELNDRPKVKGAKYTSQKKDFYIKNKIKVDRFSYEIFKREIFQLYIIVLYACEDVDSNGNYKSNVDREILDMDCLFYPDIIKSVMNKQNAGKDTYLGGDMVLFSVNLREYLKAITGCELIKDKAKDSKEQRGKNLVNGKKLNISERYQIAIEVFNVYEVLNSKNILAAEKHKLLAHLMGCNQQTARELYNGTHQKRTPVRDELVNECLKALK